MAIIIKDIMKSNNEIIRIEVSEFKGRELINVRIWYQSIDSSGNVVYKPTQKGIALSVAQFDELKDGVQKIEEYLKDREAGSTDNY